MPEFGRADAHLAFLYVSGEMDAPEAADFERRLGEEQSLRESLCHAVELTQSLEGLAPPAPSPAFRDHVRQRLGIGGKNSPLLRLRTYRGHPVLWSGLGAAAALLAVALLSALSPSGQPAQPPAQPPTPAPVANQTNPPAPVPAQEEPREEVMLDIAERWASMENGDHLARAHEEEARRHNRRGLHGEHALHAPGSSSAQP